jgi:hypothetical protein
MQTEKFFVFRKNTEKILVEQEKRQKNFGFLLKSRKIFGRALVFLSGTLEDLLFGRSFTSENSAKGRSAVCAFLFVFLYFMGHF